MKSLGELREELLNSPSKFQADIPACGGCVNFTNTLRRGERKHFTLSLDALRTALIDMLRERKHFYPQRYYKETAWRILGERYLTEKTCSTMMGVQTKPCFVILSKITHIASNRPREGFDDEIFNMEAEELEKAIRMLGELPQADYFV